MGFTLARTYSQFYEKVCAICTEPFTTGIKSKNICSFDCKMEHNRQHGRIYATTHKKQKRKRFACMVCGFSETCDLHSDEGKKYPLCPNHHALITRNIKTLEEVLACAPVFFAQPVKII